MDIENLAKIFYRLVKKPLHCDYKSILVKIQRSRMRCVILIYRNSDPQVDKDKYIRSIFRSLRGTWNLDT